MKTLTEVVRLVDAYEDPAGEATLWRLLLERAREDDPFMPRAQRVPPSRAEHKRVIKARPHHRWFLIMAGRACVGSILISMRNEIGIVLFQRYRSMGYGHQALAELLREESPLPDVNRGRFSARIHPQNFRSARLFAAAGFDHVFNVLEQRR